jgi:hypothetical protein
MCVLVGGVCVLTVTLCHIFNKHALALHTAAVVDVHVLCAIVRSLHCAPCLLKTAVKVHLKTKGQVLRGKQLRLFFTSAHHCVSADCTSQRAVTAVCCCMFSSMFCVLLHMLQTNQTSKQVHLTCNCRKEGKERLCTQEVACTGGYGYVSMFYVLI